MPFIPGKLKPRIKPRLGAKVPGTVDNAETPKNRDVEVKTPEQLVTLQVGDVSSPSGSSTSDGSHKTAKLIQNSVIAEESCIQPADSVQSPVSDKQPSGSSLNKEDVHCNEGVSSSLASSEPEPTGESAITESESSASVSVGTLKTAEKLCDKSSDVETELIDAMKRSEPSQSSPDRSQKSDETSPTKNEDISKSSLKRPRPVGLKFPKPNLKGIARVGSNPKEDRVIKTSQQTPAQSVATALGESRPTPDPMQNADAYSISTNSPDVSHGSSDGTSIISSETIATTEKSSDTSNNEPSIENSQSVDSGTSDSSPDSENAQNVFKKPRKLLKKAPVLKSDGPKSRADSTETKVGRENSETSQADSITQDSSALVTDEGIPVIDTTREISGSVPGDTNEKSSVGTETSGPGGTGKQAEDNPKVPPTSKTAKPSKGDAEDAKVLFAISAVDYLKRHDHALGDSILRRLIIGDKNMESRSTKATMCSSCNPQTLKKCLASLWAFDRSEIRTLVKKSAERQKTPSVTYASLPGKTLFKPSLGRQRAPTLTASTYGKMSFEVKERLAKQYGSNPPQLNKLRMLDLIFYNPSDNPMSQPSKKAEQKTNGGKKSESTKDSDSESDPDDPSDETDTTGSIDSNAAASSVPVPQVRIGDEGQIILAPESLVMKKKELEVMNSPVVEEFSFSDSNKKKASLDRTAWSFEDTLQFYKALHSLGTDFSMMSEMFPKRTRGNLKAKFKREERRNPSLVDKVLAAQGQTLNFSDVEKDLGADKTLRRFCLECPVTPAAFRKRSEKKSWVKAGFRSECDVNKSKPQEPSDENYKTDKADRKDSDGDKVTSDGVSENDEDGVFKRPSNVRPPRKRRTIRSTPVLPEKRKKSESAVGNGSRDTSEDEDAVFKKPRIPRKRKVVKKTEPPGPKTHLLSINLADQDDASDDTDDSASLDGSDDDCFIIKTDVKGDTYRYSRSVKVNFADPEVPIDVNETIEHDRPQTPMSETGSEVGQDNELESDSEPGEEVEVVSINVGDFEAYLEKTGAVVIESSMAIDPPEDPLLVDPLMEYPSTSSQEFKSD